MLVCSRVWFSRKLREYEHICHFTSKKNKKKKGNYANSKCTVRNLFCWRYNLRRLATTQPHEFLSGNGYRFQRPSLKTSVEIDIIWSEIGSWFGGLGSTPHPHKNFREYLPLLTPFHKYNAYCSNYSMKSYIFCFLGTGLVSFLF